MRNNGDSNKNSGNDNSNDSDCINENYNAKMICIQDEPFRYK